MDTPSSFSASGLRLELLSLLRMLLFSPVFLLDLLVLLHVSLPMSFPGEVLSGHCDLNYNSRSIIFSPGSRDVF